MKKLLFPFMLLFAVSSFAVVINKDESVTSPKCILLCGKVSVGTGNEFSQEQRLLLLSVDDDSYIEVRKTITDGIPMVIFHETKTHHFSDFNRKILKKGFTIKEKLKRKGIEQTESYFLLDENQIYEISLY